MSTPVEKSARPGSSASDDPAVQRHLSEQDETAKLAALRPLWVSWCGLVGAFARRGGARRRVDPQAFQALHGELLALCRSLAKGGDEKRRPFYRGLEDLVHPWLNADILERTDVEILLDLYRRCQRAQGELGGQTWAEKFGAWVNRGLFLVMLAAVVGLLAWASQRSWPTLLGWINDGWREVRLAARNFNDVQWWSVAGVLLVVATVFLVLRVTRR